MTDENRLANARLEIAKARTALQEARALAALGLWDGAVSRAYYAAFHAASAALVSEGLQARSHRGAHDLLFLHFVQTGLLDRQVTKDLAALQRYRDDADYGSGARFDAATGADEVERAARFVERLATWLADPGIGSS